MCISAGPGADRRVRLRGSEVGIADSAARLAAAPRPAPLRRVRARAAAPAYARSPSGRW